MTGRVALVGAGPGDPALLTVRALELLRAADVVAHDELVSEGILALVPLRATLVSVGRRAGRGDVGHRIHPDVVAHARAGAFVVRLKAGDPLIFGRGGEEAQALGEAGIPFEIVPGISAAIGAAAYTGIPLTHRDWSAQLIVTTGHRSDGGFPPPDTLAGRTLALYMAGRDLDANLAAIVAAGWSPGTPAALVIAATTADQRTVVGTLGTLACPPQELPALLLVGDVVHAATDWRADLPLCGRRVLVLGRTGIAARLRTLGAEVVELDEEPRRWPSRVDFVVVAPSASALHASAPAHIRAAPTPEALRQNELVS